MGRLRGLSILLAVLALGCNGGTYATLLRVEARSDFRLDEVSAAQTTFTLPDGQRQTRTHELVAGRDDLQNGVLVGQLEGAPAGNYQVEVSLLRSDESVVTSRAVRVEVTPPFSVVVLLPRACADIDCPEPGDDALATECDGRGCVRPECGTDAAPVEGCAPAECERGADCEGAVACAVAECIFGQCWFVGADSLCVTGQRCDVELGCVDGVDGGVVDGGSGADGGGSMGECDVDDDCPATAYGGWSGCSGWGGPCGESAPDERRDVTTYRCVARSCTADTIQQTRACTRNQSGVGCGSSTTMDGACGGFTGPCDRDGTFTRTTTDRVCRSGSCRDESSGVVMSCNRTVTGDPCSDGDPCTNDDQCSSGGVCYGIPECMGSACGGSCPIPVCTGACLDRCDCI